MVLVVEWYVFINPSDFNVSGKGKELLQSKAREQIGRVIEETQLSTLSIMGSIFASVGFVAVLGQKFMKSLKVI